MKSTLLIIVVSAILLLSCNSRPDKNNQTENQGVSENKTGVLIVSHGSHSPNWRQMLLDVETRVEEEILDSGVDEVRSAFMEYTEPSIANQLKAFDKEGFSEVIIVPLFLTVSTHTADDIQNIVGMQSNPEVLGKLEKEGIEVYQPEARITLTPLLDFPGYLKKNVTRRYKALSQDKSNEGVVLVAYGSKPYEQQWTELIVEIGKYLKAQEEMDYISYAWCGHIVNFDSNPTAKAVEQALAVKNNAVVIPILVAVDEMFQKGNIPKGIAAGDPSGEHVLYKPDAILPDPDIDQWVIDIVAETLK